MTVYNEKELVARSQNGDINAFEELVCQHERKIFTIAYRMLGNTEDASDISQEAFLRAFSAIKKFRGEASFSTWVCQIVTNLCRDELRKKYRTNVESLDEKITIGDSEIHKQLAVSEPGPEERYESKELQHKLQSLINTLSPEFRMALILRDIYGYSYDEIAEKLECSLGTVKSRINRARKYLKEQLLSEREQIAQQERLYV